MGSGLLRYTAWAACAALLLGASAVAAKPKKAPKPVAAPPAHNFVQPDLTASVPKPPSAQEYRASLALIDSVSVVRKGDAVSFDVLFMHTVVGQYVGVAKQAPEGAVDYDVTRYQASCGWRTVRRLPSEATPYEAGKPNRPFSSDASSVQDRFLEPDDIFFIAIERACEGLPLNAAKGFASAAAAVAAWKDAFSRPLPPAVTMGRRPTPPAAWTEGAAAHRFVVVNSDGETGNMLLLDRGNVVRDGTRVTAFSLALLGSEAQRAVYGAIPVAVLRKAAYDCTARTMTVVAQASWDRYGWLVRQREVSLAPRSALKSAVTKANVDAACETAADGGQSFATIDAARDFQRDQWPVSPVGAWLACAWEQLPAERRAAYITAWKPLAFQRIEIQEQDVTALRTACAIPPLYVDVVVRKLQPYAKQRAALQRLAELKLDEARLLAAWRGASWQDRLRAMWNEQGYSDEGRALQQAFFYQLATSLGLRTGDRDGRMALSAYLFGQARIEGP